MLALTYLPPSPIWVVLSVTTAFFVFVSGRMVPGMALMTAVPPASMRGAFMSVNGALQSASMGVAAWLGGALISRAPDGQVLGYERCGWLAVLTSVVMWWWVGRLRLGSASKGGIEAPH
jgi:predicted MFS family arabinose efflux permease